ncbi:DMT family transporter [Hasllibacter halocynthiae]|nr:EamA family transporter [Hasllibacter halocynthiae]
MTRRGANATGFVAVLLWSLLALLTTRAAPVPPLLLNVVCFGIGGVVGIIWMLLTDDTGALRAVPLRVYAFGTAGLFGYHLLYFSALRLAAPHGAEAQAGLIAYLWPLLIVLLSGLLPGERLRAGHLLGAVLALAGATLLIPGTEVGGTGAGALPSYALAGLCALVWAGYSVASRRLGDVPTASVAVFCLATAALSLPLHLALEEAAWPDTNVGWAALLALGAGPVGAAFYVWDIGMKRGDIQLLGTASYAAPVLSTASLVIAGVAEPNWRLGGAAALIAAGAFLAARSSRSAAPSAP